MHESPRFGSQEKLWRARARWLLRVRWFFAFSIGLLGFLAARKHFQGPASTSLTVAMTMSLANLGYSFLLHHWSRVGKFCYELFLALQLCLDQVFLAFLSASTGGGSSPYYLLFLVPGLVGFLWLKPRLASGVCAFGLAAALVVALTASPALARELPFQQLYPFSSLAAGTVFFWLLRRRSGGWDTVEVPGQSSVAGTKVQTEPLADQSGDAGERARQELIAAMAERIAEQIREPLGIVRARAEVLRLAEVRDEESQRDLGVLVKNLDVVQRSLRGILAFLPPKRLCGRIDLERLFRLEMLRIGVSPLRFVRVGDVLLGKVPGSYEELELACGLLLRLASEQSCSSNRIAVRTRALRGCIQVELRFLARGNSPLRHWPQGVGPKNSRLYLRWAIAQQVFRNHRGALEVLMRGSSRVVLRVTLQRPTEPNPTGQKAVVTNAPR